MFTLYHFNHLTEREQREMKTKSLLILVVLTLLLSVAGTAIAADLQFSSDGTAASTLQNSADATLTTSISVIADQTVFCGETTTVDIDITNVADLYGYQFEVSYDPTLVEASAAWVGSFFDTSAPAFKPWDATCASGTCQFSITHVAPQEAVSGSGTVAQIILTPKGSGTFTMAARNDILSDMDGNMIAHEAAEDLTLSVCRTELAPTVWLPFITNR